MADRVIQPSRTILLVPIIEANGVKYLVGGTPAAGTAVAAPTSQASTLPIALLNTWLNTLDDGDASAGIGGNISCSILSEDLELGEEASDTEDERTICDGASVETPTFGNAVANLAMLRDASLTDQGVFNLAYNLTNAAGLRYALIDRIQAGTTSTTPFAAGHVFSYYEVETNEPIDGVEDGQNIRNNQNFSVNEFYMDIEAA